MPFLDVFWAGPGHRLRDWVSRRSLAAGTIWKDPEVQAEDHRQGEKLFERFTWLGALAALWPVSGINKVPVPTLVFASSKAVLPSRVHGGNANLAALPPQLSSRGGGGLGLLQSWEDKETLVSMKRGHESSHERTPTKMTTISQRLSFPNQALLFDLEQLYRCLQTVPDRRKRRGWRYPLAALLMIEVLAKLAGQDSSRCAGYVRRVTHDEIADAVG